MEKFHEKNANISLKKSEIKNAKIHQKQQKTASKPWFSRKKIRKNAKFAWFLREISFLFRVFRFIHSPEIIRNFASLQNTDENFRSFSRKVSFSANPTLIPSVVSLWKGWRQDITLHTVILAANLNTEHFYFKPSKLRDQNTEIWYKV